MEPELYAGACHHVGHTVLSAIGYRIHICTAILDDAAEGPGKTPEPVLSETLVYGSCEGSEVSYWGARYASADEANSCHQALVEQWLWFLTHTLALYPDVAEYVSDYPAIAHRATC